MPVVFPTQPAAQVRSLPTAYSAPPCAHRLWLSKSMSGPMPRERLGAAITPLYPKVPQAAREDAQRYELLALTSALRVGRPRERGLASDLLSEMTRLNHA